MTLHETLSFFLSNPGLPAPDGQMFTIVIGRWTIDAKDGRRRGIACPAAGAGRRGTRAGTTPSRRSPRGNVEYGEQQRLITTTGTTTTAKIEDSTDGYHCLSGCP